jgi:hypothetical protein
LARLFGALLATALVLSVATWELNRTTFSSSYLQQKAEQTHLADHLAAGLPEALAASSTTPADTRVVLEQALTTGFIQDQIDTLLPQLERYYKEGGSLPKLDWSGLEDRITAAGLPVPPGLAATLEQPQPVSAGKLDAPVTSAVQQSQQLVWMAPMAAAILVGLVFGLARRRRWTMLAGSMLSAAFGCLLLAGLAYIPPRLITSTLGTSSAKALEPAIRSFAEAVARDQVSVFLWAAGIMAGTGLILYIVHLVLKARERISKKSDEKAAKKV